MKRKISDKIIILACIIFLSIFFVKGMFGTDRGMISADASTDTPSPSPVLLTTVTPVPTAAITQTVIATPTPSPEKLEAKFTGISATVGKKFDRSLLEVTITYSDGSDEIVTDYTVSNEVIQKAGLNTIVVMYKGLATEAYIFGRLIRTLKVEPDKLEYGIGNMPDYHDLIVTAVYSDGTEEVIEKGYEIYPDTIVKEGDVDIIVTYEGKQGTCTVLGKRWDKVLAINVSYNKPNAITNLKIDKDDLTVMAVYDDLFTERVTTFELERDTFIDSGTQALTVIYGGVKKSIDIEVLERYIVGLSAEYTGGQVIVGREFRPADMHVYLEYVDGGRMETDDYTVHTKKIRYLGTNVITVYYGDKFSTTTTIEGTELKDPAFDYVSDLSVTSGKMTVGVETAIPKYLGTDCLELTLVKKKNIKKAYRKLLLKKGKYIAFSYEFVNPDDELELPLSVRITIPEGFDMEHTFLYYTPNRKSIMGRTTKTVINDRVFECSLFKAGTYLLVYSDELLEEEYEE